MGLGLSPLLVENPSRLEIVGGFLMPKKGEDRCQQVTFCIRFGYLLCCFDTWFICLANCGSFAESHRHA
jgi:hypothetical protein